MAKHDPKAMAWDERYARPGWQFGTEPNEFLRAAVQHLPRGRVLCLAEGDGRNGVWLAQRGYDVTGVDRSAVGLEKARELAAQRGVTIGTIVADLGDFDPGVARWEGIVSIFAHVDADTRRRVHGAVARALVPGGVFLLEAYRPEQIGLGTGGPPEDARMMNLARLRDELPGLEWIEAREIARDVLEPPSHGGHSEVVQLVARRPLSGG